MCISVDELFYLYQEIIMDTEVKIFYANNSAPIIRLCLIFSQVF